MREGVAQILASEPEMQVVVSCGDLPSLLAAVEAEPPDVVVTDIRMPPTSTDEGIRLAKLLREEHPDIGVVVLSNYAEPGYALDLLESGSEGRAYLLKERVHDRSQLVAAISKSSFFIGNAKFILSDLKTWGWIVLAIGVIELFVAFGIWAGSNAARWAGIVIVSVNAIAQLLFIPAYPFWSLAIFTLDLLVLYGLVAYGGRPTLT